MGETIQIGARRQPQQMQAQRPRVRPLPQNISEWKAIALQRLGWTSKTAEQVQVHAVLAEVSGRILTSSMRGQGSNSAVATLELRKGAGDEFKAYHDQRTAFEAAPERTPEMVAELKAAAQGYIDRFELHDRARKRDPKNIAKRDACAATIKELHRFELAQQFEGLGTPPWDSAQSLKAASLRTSLAISTLPPGEQKVDKLGENTASPTFWINSKNDRGGKDKTYIFKPGATAEDQWGFPDFGEPAREAMAGRVAEMLNTGIGLSLPMPMPETQVVSVGRESLPPDSLEALKPRIGDQDSYVGSVQQFTRSEGNLKSSSRATRAQIPTRATQEMAILDIVTLNTDRHGGNFLLDTSEDGEKRLLPIDHGLSFPTRDAAEFLTAKTGTKANALMRLPGAHEAFSPELQRSIAGLDPDAMAQALKRERETLNQAHPGTGATLSDESIELSRRSSIFLKRAANRLTPAAIQVALAAHHPELFDPALDDDGFNALADRIIGEMEADQEGLKEYFLMSREMQSAVERELKAAGWDMGDTSGSHSLLTNPAIALKIWKSGIGPQRPEPRDANRPAIVLDAQTDAELQAVARAFPKMRITASEAGRRDLIEDWREWNQLGGTREKVIAAMRLVGARNSGKQDADDLGKALKLIKRGAAIQAALDADQTDIAKVDLANAIRAVRLILDAQAPRVREATEQALAPFDTLAAADGAMDPQAAAEAKTQLVAMLDDLLETGRTRLVAKLDIALADDGLAERIREQLDAALDEARNYGLGYAAGLLRLHRADLADANDG